MSACCCGLVSICVKAACEHLFRLRVDGARTSMKKSDVAEDIDDYLSRVPPDPRATLEKLRKDIKSAAPKAVETISYGIPTFKYRDRMLVSFAAFKEHCSFFPGSAPIAAHKD